VATSQLVVLGIEHLEVLEEVLGHQCLLRFAARASIGKSRRAVNRAP
jgi:hypothetical protein